MYSLIKICYHKLMHTFIPIYISDLIKIVQYYLIFVTKMLFALSTGTLVNLP